MLKKKMSKVLLGGVILSILGLSFVTMSAGGGQKPPPVIDRMALESNTTFL